MHLSIALKNLSGLLALSFFLVACSSGNGNDGSEEPALSTDALLSELSLSEGTLSPTFDPEHTSYTAQVDANIDRVAVSADLSSSGASITISDGATSANESLAQVNLAQGLNNIAIDVTAEDDSSTRTYTIEVARQPVSPKLSARAGPNSATLEWDDDTGADSYNLIYATEPGCDTRNYTTACENSELLTSVNSPYEVPDLANDQNYWFYLESVVSGVDAGISQVGARPFAPTPDDSVQSIAHDDDGTAYLGGDFTAFRVHTGSGVPLSRETGLPTGAFPKVDGNVAAVTAVTADGSGGFYIGGSFSTVGGASRHNVAHIQSDGALGDWAPEIDGNVSAIVADDDTIYIGGSFSNVDQQSQPHLAAIDTAGVLVADQSKVVDDEVTSMALDEDTLYIGGDFTEVGTHTRHNVAAIKLESDGSANVTNWNPGVEERLFCPQFIPCIEILSVETLSVADDVVYIGGGFGKVGGENRKNLAAVLADVDSQGNTVMTDWDPAPNGNVYSLALSDHVAYVGGSFSNIGGEAIGYLAAVETDTGDARKAWDPKMNESVRAMTLVNDTVHVGSEFTSAGEADRKNLAAFETDSDGNAVVTSWRPDPDREVRALAHAGDAVYAGGEFGNSLVEPRAHLAAITADGKLSDWNPSANDAVLTLAVDDEVVYAGGDFTELDGDTRLRLAAIGTDGSLSTNWAPEADASVKDIMVSNPSVYLTGAFNNIDSNTRDGLAAITTFGTLSPWNPGLNGVGVGNALAKAGNRIFVGGNFNEVDGSGGSTTVRDNLAALDADTSRTPAVDAFSADANDAVNAIAVDNATNDTLYFVGEFTNVAGSLRSGLAAADMAGSGSLLSWDISIGSGSPDALVIASDVVYVGGDFNTTEVSNLAAIATDSTGTLLDWKPDPDSNVSALSVANDKLYVGGEFEYIADKLAPNFSPIELYNN